MEPEDIAHALNSDLYMLYMEDNIGTLNRKTHYFLNAKFHKSRLQSAIRVVQGLFLKTVETLALDADNTKRGHRVVLFDLRGMVAYASEFPDGCGSKRRVQKDFEAWLGEFCPQVYYKDLLESERKKLTKRIAAIDNLLED
jgi:hypothetical protein